MANKIRFKSYRAQLTPDVKCPEKNSDNASRWLAVLSMVLTSDKVDRDGDVLQPQGASVDPESPLLWQHDMQQPIGKLLRFSMDNEHTISGAVGLLPGPQGEDVLEKAEMGVLRVSIGFVPLEIEPRKVDGRIVGNLINKYEIVEVSLVSVPSNTDAIITRIDRLSRESTDSDKLKFFSLFQKHLAAPLGKRRKMSNKSIDKMIRRLQTLQVKDSDESDGKPRQNNDQGKPPSNDNNQQNKPNADQQPNNDPKKQLQIAIEIVQALTKVDLSNVDLDKVKELLNKLQGLLRSVLQSMDQDKDTDDDDEVDKEPEDMETTSASGTGSGGNSSQGAGAGGNSPQDGKNVVDLWERLMGRRSLT